MFSEGEYLQFYYYMEQREEKKNLSLSVHVPD